MASKRGNRSVLDRSAGYDTKVDPTRIGGVVDTQRARMVNNYASQAEDQFTIEADTKGYMGNQGVSPLKFTKYLGFAKQIFRLRRRGYSGISLVNEVLAKAVTWADRGLVNATLEGVAALQGVVIVVP